MTSDTSSEAGESTGAPEVHPKIPPPPSEQPPPYTPFGGQTATLLPSTSTAVAGTNRQTTRTPVVVRGTPPEGWRKYSQYLTKRNIAIAAAALCALVIFIVLLHVSNTEDEEEGIRNESLPGTRQLEVKSTSLGAFRNFDQKISFDENTDSVILSKYEPAEQILKCEKIYPEEFQAGFVHSRHNITEEYVDCVRFTDQVICCSTSPHGRHHRTDCYYEENGEEIRSVAVKYDFIADWQSLADDKLLLIVHNRQRHAVFDIKENRVNTIEENRLPHGYLSVGFFFPMDTEKELEELVRSGQEFRVCSYLKTNKGEYALKDEDCKQTPFNVEFELPKVRFCSNPLYTAVVQFGHHESDSELTWHLRVKYDSSNDVYSAFGTVESPYEQLAMDCNDETLDVFVVGATELHRFSAQLPNLRQEHFIQPRLR